MFRPKTQRRHTIVSDNALLQQQVYIPGIREDEYVVWVANERLARDALLVCSLGCTGPAHA